MRSRETNFLQGVILLTAVVYLVLGLALLGTPLRIMDVFSPGSEEIQNEISTSGQRIADSLVDQRENWQILMRKDYFVSALYFLRGIFSLLLLSTGLSLILPLFDPLKYRGLAWISGAFFPLFGTIYFTVSQILFLGGETQKRHALAGCFASPFVRIMGVLFIVLFVLNIIALICTKSQSEKGLE